MMKVSRIESFEMKRNNLVEEYKLIQVVQNKSFGLMNLLRKLTDNLISESEILYSFKIIDLNFRLDKIKMIVGT